MPAGPTADAQPTGDVRLRRKRERAARKAELAAREVFFAEAGALTAFLGVDVGDLLLFVSTRDLGVGRRVFVHRKRKDMATLAKALEVLRELPHRLPNDAVFVEVGANIGTTTLIALRRHPFASAVALEPSPDNFRLLRVNVAANGLEAAVTALPAAASDSRGRVAFDVSSPNRGGHRIAREPSAEAVTVDTVTLDDLVEQGTIEPDRVGLVWIDAAGGEDQALLGARRIVEAGVPVVAAIRPRQIEAGSDLAELLGASYTDVIELRKQHRRVPVAELAALSASYRHKGDILLVRRR